MGILKRFKDTLPPVKYQSPPYSTLTIISVLKILYNSVVNIVEVIRYTSAYSEIRLSAIF